MKKFFSILMLTSMFLVGFISCSKDDEPGGDFSKVVGTWYGDDYDTFYSNVTISFNSDGTGSATMEHFGAFLTAYRASFTYKVKGNKVTTKGTMANANSDGETSTQDFNNEYELQGNKLVVKKGNNWYIDRVNSYKR